MSKMSKDQAERRREIVGFLLLASATLLFLALTTDDYQGNPERSFKGMASVPNSLGAAGAITAGVLSMVLGHAAHILYFLLSVWGIMLVRHRPLDRFPMRLLGLFVLTGAVAGLLHVNPMPNTGNPVPGGILGAFIGGHLLPVFERAGSNIIAGTLGFIGILLATELLFLRLFTLLRGLSGMAFRAARLLLVDGSKELYRVSRTMWAAHRARAVKRRQPFREIAARILAEGETRTASKSLVDESVVPEPVVDELAGTANTESHEAALAAETPTPLSDVPAAEPEVEEDLSRIRIRMAPPVPPKLEQQDLPLANADPAPPLPDEEAPLADPALSVAAFSEDPSLVLEEVEEAVAMHTPFNVVANAEQIDEEFSIEPEPSKVDDIQDEEVPEAGLLTAEVDGASGDTPAVSMDEQNSEAAEEEAQDEAAPDAQAMPVVEQAPEAPAKPILRCKGAIQDELPLDYVYPKQYTKPSMDIFDHPPVRISTDESVQLRRTSVKLEETLKTFNIEARVTEVQRGPTITRFELQPAPGIKVSRFHALTDDIALALKAHGVRIEAPIPGKGRVGIEVPNVKREPVVVRELFETEMFQKDDAQLKLTLGKDIAGEAINADLATMPHLLVAGATGAGKTVCVKTFLASLLFMKEPDEMQLILIDPKMVELSIFNDIPHLITPVVTDPKKAATSLNWLINEMEERYRLFAHLRVRNIEVYNDRVANGEIEMVTPDSEGKTSESITVNRKLPYIVCIIDELADLMMLARSEVEDAIARLAQLARATGIHLIIATQRPSVDVLTGVIKANFPARLSFQVSSRVDSRCILDEIGAERLIGMGDLLYLPAGRSKPLRIQGAFVSDSEMEALIAYLKMQAPPQYRDEIEQFGQAKEAQEALIEETDELFEDAVRVVMDTGQASISMVQRRLRVGYTRAARLIDMMELKGIVGPHTGSKARDILVGAAPRKTDEVA